MPTVEQGRLGGERPNVSGHRSDPPKAAESRPSGGREPNRRGDGSDDEQPGAGAGGRDGPSLARLVEAAEQSTRLVDHKCP